MERHFFVNRDVIRFASQNDGINIFIGGGEIVIWEKPQDDFGLDSSKKEF